MALTTLVINNLLDHGDLELDLTKKPLFLVGPNGTGKSTTLKIVHALLTGQWYRLSRMPFSTLVITLDDLPISLERGDFALLNRFKALFSRAPRRRGSIRLPLEWEAATQYIRPSTPMANDAARMGRVQELYPFMSRLFNYAEHSTSSNVLFYPTYRRVERDIRELLVFAEDEPEDESFTYVPKVRDRFEKLGEVIGFGGQDIEQLISVSATTIENAARQALNEHSVKFLEVLNAAESIKSGPLRENIIDEQKSHKLLSQINNIAPGTIDVISLQSGIEKLRNKLTAKRPGRLSPKDEIFIYYVSELINVFSQIDGLSRPLTNFCELMTGYFAPRKRVVLSEDSYQVNVLDVQSEEPNPINFEDLSSGEKQVLSIFAFLMLPASDRGAYVIVDEPELSLSVSWQKRLIRDMMNVRGPEIFLVATHSPFIFQDFSLDNVITFGDL